MIPVVVVGGALALLYYAMKGKLGTDVTTADDSTPNDSTPNSSQPANLTNNPAIDLAMQTVSDFEGLSLTVYPDPKGQTKKWSIGWGHQVQPGEPYFPNTSVRTISKEEADSLLRIDVVGRYTFVMQLVTVELSDNQIAALVSFCYNEGRTAFQNSTLLKLVNEGNFDAAAAQFPKWIYETVNGQKIISATLVDRRKQEQDLFQSA